MRPAANALDLLARRIIRAGEEDLRHWLGNVQLDRELLGALYLRVREVLERSDTDDIATAEELAMTIYFTASAWQPNGDAPLELLQSLHQLVSKTFEETKEGTR